MGHYKLNSRRPKPFTLSDGDVVLAQPGRSLIISDELDGSTSVAHAVKKGLLIRVDVKEEVVAVAPVVKEKAKSKKAPAAKEKAKDIEVSGEPELQSDSDTATTNEVPDEAKSGEESENTDNIDDDEGTKDDASETKTERSYRRRRR